MKNTFRFLLVGLFLCLSFASFVSSNKIEDYSSIIISRFNKIWIGEPQEKVYIQTDKPYYSSGEDIWMKGFVVNATTHQSPSLSRFLYVELTNPSDSLITRIKIRRDSVGFAGSIKLKSDLAEGYYTLRAFTYWMQNESSDFFFSKKIFIGNSISAGSKTANVPKSKKGGKNQVQQKAVNDFDVQFFPESGPLLTNSLQNVAFKAIGNNGLSVEITGKIFNEQNEEILSFRSLDKGMGKFILNPDRGVKYHAMITSSTGLEKRFELPLSQTEGVAIHLANYGGNIIYEVINHTTKPNSSLYLLAHSRGKVYVISQVAKLNGKIPESALPAGINSFSVIDSIGNTLCERLLFDWTINQPKISMQSSKSSYGRREPVDLNFNIRSVTGKSNTGQFAISVTDSRTVLQDTLADNILSYLLLSSDIKGYVEEPASYFSGNQAAGRAKMDLLMMTQGWRRFSTPQIVKGVYPNLEYYLELGQALSGKVKNVLGKPSKKCDVIMLSAYKNSMRISQTDSLGRYLIEGLEFPDSTSFILKANKKKSILDVEIIPDSDFFAKSRKIIPIPVEGSAKIPAEYLQQSLDKYNFEGGMHVNLAEITVEAKKIEENPGGQYYSGMGDARISRKDLDRFQGMSIMTAISMLPGVQVLGDKISIRGSMENPTIMVDGFAANSIDEISYLTTFDVEQIEVFKGASAAIFGSRGGNGVIAITLKTGADMTAHSTMPISLRHIFPLGYQKPTYFYTPKYEVDSIRRNPVPDLRTTIYWNPTLKTDSTGVMHVKFFTADKENNYQVVLEGITDEGELCRYLGIIKRENN